LALLSKIVSIVMGMIFKLIILIIWLRVKLQLWLHDSRSSTLFGILIVVHHITLPMTSIISIHQTSYTSIDSDDKTICTCGYPQIKYVMDS